MSAPTAAQVRSYLRARPEKVAALSPEAQATVAEGARGRLHQDAVKVYNAKRAKSKRYVLGASKSAEAQRQADRARLRKAGLLGENARGPLSKAAKEFLKS